MLVYKIKKINLGKIFAFKISSFYLIKAYKRSILIKL